MVLVTYDFLNIGVVLVVYNQDRMQEFEDFLYVWTIIAKLRYICILFLCIFFTVLCAMVVRELTKISTQLKCWTRQCEESLICTLCAQVKQVINYIRNKLALFFTLQIL